MTTCLRRQPEPTDQLVSRPRIHARCMCLAHRTTRLLFLDADCSQSSGTSCPSSRRVPAPAAKATPLDPGLHLWLCAHAPGKLPAVWTCWAPGVQPNMARHSTRCQWAAPCTSQLAAFMAPTPHQESTHDKDGEQDPTALPACSACASRDMRRTVQHSQRAANSTPYDTPWNPEQQQLATC